MSLNTGFKEVPMATKEVLFEDFCGFLGECFGLTPEDIVLDSKIVDFTSTLGLMYFAMQVHTQYGVNLPLSSRGFTEETTVRGALDLINSRAA